MSRGFLKPRKPSVYAGFQRFWCKRTNQNILKRTKSSILSHSNKDNSKTIYLDIRYITIGKQVKARKVSNSKGLCRSRLARLSGEGIKKIALVIAHKGDFLLLSEDNRICPFEDGFDCSWI